MNNFPQVFFDKPLQIGNVCRNVSLVVYYCYGHAVRGEEEPYLTPIAHCSLSCSKPICKTVAPPFRFKLLPFFFKSFLGVAEFFFIATGCLFLSVSVGEVLKMSSECNSIAIFVVTFQDSWAIPDCYFYY